MSRVIALERWVQYRRLRDEGHSISESCRRTGISTSAAARYERGDPSSTGLRVKALAEAGALPKVKTGKQLRKDAARALEDFEYFRLRYFGHRSTPWQIDAAQRMVEYLALPEKVYVVVNVGPGVGKSTLFSHDFPAWLAARDRSIRCMIGSISETTVRDYTRRLRNTFDRTSPDTATSEEIAKDTKVDAQATMTADYGRFKPERKDRWQERSFVIATEKDQAGSDKEASFAGFGQDSAFIGGRYDLIIWDDLENLKTIPTLEQREQREKWFKSVAESRLEPGGLFILMGQRLHADDLYSFALGQRDLLFDEDGELLPEAEQEHAPGRYKHIIYKAHYEELCAEGSHKMNAPAWKPDGTGGCLLDPKRLSWRELAPIRAQYPREFAIVYQQEDTLASAGLVHKDWIEGGKGENGEYFPGCKDKDRGLLEIPDGLLGKHLRIVTVDPSVERYWSVQDWLYGQESKYRHLLNLLNQTMLAPDLLGWNMQSRVFYGVLESWWQISKDQGKPIQYVIVEEVAAHKYLLQYDHVKEWQRQRKVRIIGHDTHRNKSDAKYGVQGVGPVWRSGLVRLPWGDEPGRQASMKLIHQVTRWTPSAKIVDDNLMAQWFLEWQLGTNALFKPTSSEPPRRANMPRWMGRSA
jgi:hypothetical protein